MTMTAGSRIRMEGVVDERACAAACQIPGERDIRNQKKQRELRPAAAEPAVEGQAGAEDHERLDSQPASRRDVHVGVCTLHGGYSLQLGSCRRGCFGSSASRISSMTEVPEPPVPKVHCQLSCTRRRPSARTSGSERHSPVFRTPSLLMCWYRMSREQSGAARANSVPKLSLLGISYLSAVQKRLRRPPRYRERCRVCRATHEERAAPITWDGPPTPSRSTRDLDH